MTRYFLPAALGVAALLAPGLAHAQKPTLPTAPTVPTAPPPAPPALPAEPVPAPTAPAPADTVRGTYTPPAGYDRPAGLPAPSSDSPSGFELPEREQKRRALQEHAEMYTKMFVYTGLGLGYTSSYGVSQFSFSASPALGYRVTDRFSVGPGISYAYNNYGFDTNINTTEHISTNSLGFKVFAQFMVYKQFFVHGEFESTKAEFAYIDNYGNLTTTSRQVQTPLLGGGYRSQISNRVAADILLLYNFKDDYQSIYPNPVIRFNFLFNIGR